MTISATQHRHVNVRAAAGTHREQHMYPQHPAFCCCHTVLCSDAICVHVRLETHGDVRMRSMSVLHPQWTILPVAMHGTGCSTSMCHQRRCRVRMPSSECLNVCACDWDAAYPHLQRCRSDPHSTSAGRLTRHALITSGC